MVRITMLLFLITVFCMESSIKPIGLKYTPGQFTVTIEIDEVIFTPENLYTEIRKQGILFPNIVYRQALLETGRFRSVIFKENKNLFGMRVPYQRPRAPCLIGENRGHAQYTTWQCSVRDYKIWQNYMIRIGRLDTSSRLHYYYSLDMFYAEASNYSLKLQEL